ncbi:hypothetical protein BDV95DRAFT_589102 [Massariosphaeria phaeospora]|uniref:Uncharacterized protein n=1 Tax=Massariosphaeria phaeospora TaxID=100035 RepID=A0A7C8IF68_9PLEO|nr:hypothetical protein BDV95DRAFT_589102 [Massariosphaeria phaeospora]
MHSAVIFAGLVAAANAYAYNTTIPEAPVYTTKVVVDYTTVCPGPTEIPINGITYTVTTSTTLVVTDCHCTITEVVPPPPAETPIYSSGVEIPVETPVVPSVPAHETPAVPSPPAPVYPSGNGTVPTAPAAPTGTAPGAPGASPTAPPEFEGAAAATKAGLGLIGLAGALVAFL